MLFSLHNYSIKVNWLENFRDGEWKSAGIFNACFILLDLAAYWHENVSFFFNKILLLKWGPLLIEIWAMYEQYGGNNLFQMQNIKQIFQ